MTSETKVRSGKMLARNEQPNGESFRERLRLHDPEALERFFELYFDSVYGRVRNLVGSTRDAEALTQDIFQRIHRSLPKLEPGTDLGPWVLSTAIEHVREHSANRVFVPGATLDDFPVHAPDGLGLPAAAVELLGNGKGGTEVEVKTEDLANLLGLVLVHDEVLVHEVEPQHGSPACPKTFLPGRAHLVARPLGDDLALELREAHQDVQDELTHARRRVELLRH